MARDHHSIPSLAANSLVRVRASSRTNRGVPMGGFIPAENLVLNGTAGDNGTRANGIKKRDKVNKRVDLRQDYMVNA